MPNGVFWVTVIGKTSNNCLLVENITKGLKKVVKELTLPIEPDLVYPLLRGGEAKKWFAKPNLYIIFKEEDFEGFERRGCCAVVLYKTNGFQFIFHCRCKGLPTATRTEQGS